MPIYFSKYPLEAKAILKYSKTVNVLQKKGGNFIAFDDNMRYRRQCQLSARDVFHTEQYVEVMTSATHPPTSAASAIPNGFCFEHHEGRFCAGCRHSHKCPWCGGPTQPQNIPHQVAVRHDRQPSAIRSISPFVDSSTSGICPSIAASGSDLSSRTATASIK